ncbi:hypothetical protein PIB30_089984 [Stylosanthes scabra]|uniref:CCHC-type domain-containing protein n=1 Tax=Stylosanthes scabra TaxID=79078 RepID=A0ABU6YRQ7_9FABA|nr:hypothetical protein [Stylosanthes scabra]
MPPPFRTPSYRPTKKRRRGPPEEEGSSQSHLYRVVQIQRCSKCGAAGHKKRRCPKPVTRGSKFTKGGTKRSSSQPPPESHKKKLTKASSSQPQPIYKPAGLESARFGPKKKPTTTPSTIKPAQPKKQPTTKASSSNSKPSSQPIHKKASKSTKPTSSSQPIGKRAQFSVTNYGNPHVSPQKLRLMAKLPQRDWGNL